MQIAGLILYSIYFASMIFCWRALSSISIFLLIILGLLSWIITVKKPFLSRSSVFFLCASALYLALVMIVQFTGPSYLPELSLKSGLVAVPLALLISWPQIKQRVEPILTIYCSLLFIASVYCLLSSDNYFYHDLVRPIHQHAVYFSIYLLLAIYFLQQQWTLSPMNDALLRHGLSVYFSFFILLLASKLVICFLVLFWLLRITAGLDHSWKIGAALLLVLSATLVTFTNNPVGNRFRDSLSGDPQLSSREHFDPGIYFNGAQFRLLQWKLVPEILSRKNAWLTGLGPVNAQPALNKAYEEKDMYLGDGKQDIGYRAFNCHNQLLESVLRYGLAGMAIFIFLWLVLLYLAISIPGQGAGLLIGMIMIYALVESVWETQYGILLFSGWPILLDQLARTQPLKPLKRL